MDYSKRTVLMSCLFEGQIFFQKKRSVSTYPLQIFVSYPEYIRMSRVTELAGVANQWPSLLLISGISHKDVCITHSLHHFNSCLCFAVGYVDISNIVEPAVNLTSQQEDNYDIGGIGKFHFYGP